LFFIGDNEVIAAANPSQPNPGSPTGGKQEMAEEFVNTLETFS
jgi:hypothetical protein